MALIAGFICVFALGAIMLERKPVVAGAGLLRLRGQSRGEAEEIEGECFSWRSTFRRAPTNAGPVELCGVDAASATRP